MLVLAPTSPCDDGYFGDLLATSAMARGCRALVIDAGVRDVARPDARWAFRSGRRRSARRARSRRRWASVNVPMVCAGAQCRAGRRDRGRRRRRLRGARARRRQTVLENGRGAAREGGGQARAARRGRARPRHLRHARAAGRQGPAAYESEAASALPLDARRHVEGRRTSSPPTCPRTRRRATRSCCASWARPTRARSTAWAAPTR